jgi:hypothetical protein
VAADIINKPANAPGLPEALTSILALIDSGKLGQAEQALFGVVEQPAELVELVRIKLSVARHDLDVGVALQNVVAFLRKDPSHPVALEIYQELSLSQYQAGHSCLSHSHPPPARSI